MADIKRKDAARLIDSLLSLVAAAKENKKTVIEDLLGAFEQEFKECGLTLPTKCNGEAHSNPHIDNCGVCMPRWGWCSHPTKVK